MQEQDGTTATAPRFDVLHEALAQAAKLGVTVTLTVHAVPTEVALDWLQEGLLDAIEKGAPGNGPTGRMHSGEWPTGKAELTVFTEDERERERRIERQQDAAVEELAATLVPVTPEARS